MKKMAVMLIAAIFFAWGTLAHAEQGSFEKLGAVCGEEIEKLCPQVVLGGGRILACLEKNQDKLSKECDNARINAQKQFESQGEGLK